MGFALWVGMAWGAERRELKKHLNSYRKRLRKVTESREQLLDRLTRVEHELAECMRNR